MFILKHDIINLIIFFLIIKNIGQILTNKMKIMKNFIVHAMGEKLNIKSSLYSCKEMNRIFFLFRGRSHLFINLYF